MRLLLLLVVAFGTAIAMPSLIYGLQPELLPGGGGVTEGWTDIQEIAKLLQESWQSGRPPPEPDWDESRLVRAFTVGGTAAVWLIGFLPGGVLGLLLLNVRRTTLLVVAGLLALALYSCSRVQVTHDLTPETVRMVKRFAGLALVAALAGFVTARSFRRIAV